MKDREYSRIANLTRVRMLRTILLDIQGANPAVPDDEFLRVGTLLNVWESRLQDVRCFNRLWREQFGEGE